MNITENSIKERITERNNPDQSDLFSKLHDGNDKMVYCMIKSAISNHNDADDIYSDVILYALKSINQLKNHKGFKSWLYRIAQSKITDYWRARRNRERYETQTNTTLELSREDLRSEERGMNLIAEEKEELLRLAYKALNALPEKLRVAFTLHHVEGMSFREIAETLEIHENTVKYRVKKAEALLSQRTKQMVIVGIAASIDPERVSILTQKAIDTFLTMQPETTIVTATMATSAVGTSNMSGAIGFSFHGVISALALPFLWIMSLLIGGRACGTAFVVNAPSLAARRWIIKHLLFCYCGLMILPVLFFTINSPVIYFLTGRDYERIVTSVFNWITFAAVIMYMAWLQSTYKTISATNVTDKDQGQYLRLWHIVLSGFLLSTTLIIGFCTWILTMVIIPSMLYCWESQKTIQFLVSAVSFVLVAPPLLFHLGSLRLFRRFLSISKDAQTFQETASFEPLCIRDICTLELLLCVTITIVPSLLHLILIQTRIIYSVFELLIFSLAWGLIYYQNTKYRDKREMLVLGMFVIQIIVMWLVRDFVFV